MFFACEWHTRLSRESNDWSFVLVGGTAVPTLVTALSDVDEEEPHEFQVFVGRQKRTSST